MGNITSLQRKNIRSEFREKRRGLSGQQQALAANDILAVCLSKTKLAQANTVVCYLANDGEISPNMIVEYCWRQKKRVLLPVLHPFTKGHLLFVEYNQNSPMHKNRYGIEEPITSSQNVCPLADIELILTPLVAFDTQGNRLGMGGGYYDRTLAPVRRDVLPTQLIGLAHTCQQADMLRTDSWDIPLDGIATPKQYFSIG